MTESMSPVIKKSTDKEGDWIQLAGTIATVLSITGAIIYHGVIAYEIYNSTWSSGQISVTVYLIVLNICLCTGLAFLTRGYIDKTKRIKSAGTREGKLKKTIDAHIFVANQMEALSVARTGITTAFQKVYQTGSINDDMYKNCEDDYYKYTQKLLTKTEKMFHEITGEHCGVCIKLFIRHHIGENNGSSTNTMVRTLSRDNVTSEERNRAADTHEPFEYYENTAFVRICNDPDAPDYFVCNDLLGMGEAYSNKRPAWRKDYNATAVVPIKDPTQSATTETTMGFLSVDNKHGGFDEDHTIHILQNLANTLYYIMSSRELLHGFLLNKGDIQ